MADNKTVLSELEKERIQKAIMTSSLSGGGLLSPEDAVKFINALVDQSAILKAIRIEKMTKSTKNIDVFDIAARQLRKHEEAKDPGFRAGITTSRNTLTSIKCMLPVEISEDTFEQNIEKEGFEDTILNGFALAYGNDLADLAINGDILSVNPFLNINDGFVKLAKAKCTRFDATASGTDYKAIFSGMLKTLPDKYKINYDLLTYYVSPSVELAYRESLAERESLMGDEYLDKNRRARYMGILIDRWPYMPDDVFFLGPVLNFVMGIEYGIKIKKDEDIYADTRQYAITTKTDVEYAIDEATCIGYDF